jgi:hypothetical protein
MLSNTKNQLISLSLIAVIFLACTLAIVLSTDPFKASKLVIVAFYACLTGFLFSFFSFTLFLVRSRSVKRQAIFLTILIVGLLILSSHQLLFWWVGLLFTAMIILLEAFFLVT